MSTYIKQLMPFAVEHDEKIFLAFAQAQTRCGVQCWVFPQPPVTMQCRADTQTKNIVFFFFLAICWCVSVYIIVERVFPVSLFEQRSALCIDRFLPNRQSFALMSRYLHWCVSWLLRADCMVVLWFFFLSIFMVPELQSSKICMYIWCPSNS